MENKELNAENLPESSNSTKPVLPATPQHHKLTKSEIESLFIGVNTGRRYYVDTTSHRLVDELINLWFESQGFDFWTCPEVERWEVNEVGEVDFWYSR